MKAETENNPPRSIPQSMYTTKYRQIPVRKFMTVEHTHSHDSGDDRDSASDVESVAYQSSVSSVPLHSHGTTDSDEFDDHSGLTSDGSDHIRG